MKIKFYPDYHFLIGIPKLQLHANFFDSFLIFFSSLFLLPNSLFFHHSFLFPGF